MSTTQTPEQNDWVRRVLGIDPAESRSAATAAAPPAALYTKSRMAWVATRAKVEGDIAKLHGALTSTYQGHGAAEHLEKAFQARVEVMMNALDHSLAEKLDEVNQ
ncbi:MAG TPA: hypothetical protein VJK90_01475, partial [Acetobacteraceae bacterium]|nr:hypothetical protein [Acetobacteraceae bacterium]